LVNLCINPIDDVADGTHTLEFGGRNLAAGIFLQLHHQIDRIDAVEIEVIEKPCAQGDLLRWQVEQVLQIFRKYPQ